MERPIALSQVEVEVREGVALITLANERRRNAISPVMVDEVVSVLDDLEDRADVSCLVVTGRGTAFCAGAELGSVARAADEPEAAAEAVRAVYQIFLRVGQCSLPTIAAVNGPAVGAGLNLALVCDVRIASESASFSSKFLDLALHPGGGHTWLLRQAVGAQVASAMVLAGEKVSGREAEKVGLVWRCVADQDLLDAATRIAEKVTQVPRALLIDAKESIRQMASIGDHLTAVDLELPKQLRSAQQAAFQERIAPRGSAPKTTD